MAAHGEPGVRTILALDSHRHQGREPACERCRRDDGTARRSTASVACTGADDDPSSRRRPFRSPSRSHVQPPPLPVPRSATALRKRPRTDVRSAWSSASSESGLNRPAFSFDQCSVLAYTWSPRTGVAEREELTETGLGVDRKMLWSLAASSSQQRARVLTDVKARRFAPPPLRGADGLDAGSAHARPDWLLSTMLTHTPSTCCGRRPVQNDALSGDR